MEPRAHPSPSSTSERTSQGQWHGVILAGGASRRFGSDKSLAEVDGEVLVLRVADSMARAGLASVTLVGAADPVVSRTGLTNLADRWPGEGPLGGLLTALVDAGDHAGVLVCGCDHPDLDPEVLMSLMEAADQGADVAVARAGEDTPQWLVSAWRASTASALQRAFDAGERSPSRAAIQAGLRLVFVDADPSAVADIDSLEQLAARQRVLDRRGLPA